MISIRDLCRRRHVDKLDLQTPILIPSFSSKGFPDILSTLTTLKDNINDAALVSSYDIYYENISLKLLSPNLLFIDSGGFEAGADSDLSEIYANYYQPRDWNRALHIATLDKIDSLSSIVLISYDDKGNNIPLIEQITQAHDLFSRYPDTATDFLVKPYNGSFIEISIIESEIQNLSSFDIIGFTEKELGNSLAERLAKIAEVRKTFQRANLDKPIHIFGCLDPLSTRLFYLCGADIFDGLSWLRFGYHESLAIYRNNWSVIAGVVDAPDDEIQLLIALRNIEMLGTLAKNLETFASNNFDDEVLGTDRDLLEIVLNAAGVTMF